MQVPWLWSLGDAARKRGVGVGGELKLVQVPWLRGLGDAARKRVLNWCRSPGCEAWVTQLARGGGGLNWCRSPGCEAWVTQLAGEGEGGGRGRGGGDETMKKELSAGRGWRLRAPHRCGAARPRCEASWWWGGYVAAGAGRVGREVSGEDGESPGVRAGEFDPRLEGEFDQ